MFEFKCELTFDEANELWCAVRAYATEQQRNADAARENENEGLAEMYELIAAQALKHSLKLNKAIREHLKY